MARPLCQQAVFKHGSAVGRWLGFSARLRLARVAVPPVKFPRSTQVLLTELVTQ